MTNASLEQGLSISIVHGGYVLYAPDASGDTRTEIFNSTAKLLKAVRGVLETHTLLPKKADKADDAAAE
jgi:hypothetical protein